jgi:hypothetical protein
LKFLRRASRLREGELENGKLIGTWVQHTITVPLNLERAKAEPDKAETGKQAAAPEP